MNPAQLLNHFDRIAEAPEAVPRLRRFILDLAVRGKLVEQDLNDEPASELLKRIQAQKVQLVNGRKANNRQLPPPFHVGAGPFTLPFNWTWTRLGEIGDWGSGSTPPRGHGEYYGDDVAWLKSGELGDCLALTGSEERVTHLALQKCSFRLNKPGDVLIAMYGATIGKLAILAEEAVTNQAVCGCTPAPGIFNKYLFLFLLSRREDLRGQSEGGAQPNISKVKIVTSAFALPPLAEQHRIVTKVDELMALCDRLEAAQSKREQRRDRLVAASLNRINQPAPSADGEAAAAFREHARFHLDHLPRLTTRPEHIKSLRQTILNLAIRGELVEQDPNDETVRNIAQEITTNCRGKMREVIEGPFDLPPSWAWSAIDAISDQVTDGEHTTPPRIAGLEVPLVTAKNVRDGFMDYSKTDWVSFNTAEKAWNRCRPEVGDILLVCVGATTGRLTVLRDPRDMVLVRSVALIRPGRDVDAEYLERAIRSSVLQMQIWASVKATAQPCLYINKIKSLLVPLPPLPEQHRIVAKVDELMAVCDQLEAQLNATQTDSRRLLEAVLQEALAPATERAMTA